MFCLSLSYLFYVHMQLYSFMKWVISLWSSWTLLHHLILLTTVSFNHDQNSGLGSQEQHWIGFILKWQKIFGLMLETFFYFSTSFLWGSTGLNSWATSVITVPASFRVCSEVIWSVLTLSCWCLSCLAILKTY